MFLFWLLCKYDNTCNVCSQVKWWDFEASTLVTDTLWFQTAVFCQRRCGIREVSLNGKSAPNFHPKQAGRSLLASHAPLSAELHCCAISCERYFGMVFDICAFMCRFSLGQYRHFTRRSKGSSEEFDLQVLRRVNNNNSRSSTKDNLNIQFHPKVQGLIKDHNLSKPILSAHVRSFEKNRVATQHISSSLAGAIKSFKMLCIVAHPRLQQAEKLGVAESGSWVLRRAFSIFMSECTDGRGLCNVELRLCCNRQFQTAVVHDIVQAFAMATSQIANRRSKGDSR